MVSKQNLPHEKPQNLKKHPDQWESDLNPHRGAGQNVGSNVAVQPGTTPASDIKALVRKLHEFTMDELRQIPVIDPGSRLKQGATYVDLADPRRRAFEATGGSEVAPDNYFIPKAEVAYMLWNRLLRVPESERKQ